MIQSKEINHHDVVNEVTHIFLDYESALMNNDVEALNQYFWQDPSDQTAGKARNGRHKAQSWYVEGRWSLILEQLVTHLSVRGQHLLTIALTRHQRRVECRPVLDLDSHGPSQLQ